MKNSLLITFLAAGIANAATITHTTSYTISESYGAVAGPTQVVDGDYFKATAPAFDTGLGTLQSFTLTWTLAGSFTGPLAAPGGAGGVGYSGAFLIDGIGFATSGNGPGSGGGGNGSGGPGGMVLNLAFTAPGNPLSFTRTFLVSEAGVDYDQAILDAVLGGSAVPLEWDTPLTITGTYDSLTVTGSGSVALAYNYVPEPSVAVLGVVAIGSAFLRRRR